MVVITKIDPISAGKMTGLMFAIIAFLYALFFVVVAVLLTGLLGSMTGIGSSGVSPTALPGFSSMFPGLGSIPAASSGASGFNAGPLFVVIALVGFVFFLVLFFILGFILGAVGAALYNAVSPRIGGIKVELSEK